MSNYKDYKKTVSLIVQSVNRINRINSDEEIATPYKDEFTTVQQRARDKEITELLRLYVQAYKYKNNSNKWYKGILFSVCAVILLTFTFILGMVVVKFGRNMNKTTTESMIQLVSICITYLTLIIGILKIITKYVFPANDEEYITRIVEIIQNNDLENKKENIRVAVGDLSTPDVDSVESDSKNNIEIIDKL